MKDRIRQIMEAQHMTQQVFAEFIGTTAATLSGIFNERTKPTLNIVELIKKKIPDINTDWLLFGAGNMYLPHGGGADEPAAAADGLRGAADGLHGAVDGLHPGNSFSEAVLQFDVPSAPTPQPDARTPRVGNSVRSTRQDYQRDDAKIFDKPLRHVTEIRVYYSDQTWESFVPSKK